MTAERFIYQREIAAGTSGVILNIGCYDDPAELKAYFGTRVLHCDRYRYGFDGRELPADRLFDATADGWPFHDDFAELAIFSDVLEHWAEEQIVHALQEARRVASKLLICCPQDDRANDPVFLAKNAAFRPGETHITYLTKDLLRGLLAATGWTVTRWQTVDYTFVPVGFFIEAERGPC